MKGNTQACSLKLLLLSTVVTFVSLAKKALGLRVLTKKSAKEGTVAGGWIKSCNNNNNNNNNNTYYCYYYKLFFFLFLCIIFPFCLPFFAFIGSNVCNSVS